MRSSATHRTGFWRFRAWPEAAKLPWHCTALLICSITTGKISSPRMYWYFRQTAYFQTIFPTFCRSLARRISGRWVLICLPTGSSGIRSATVKTAVTRSKKSFSMKSMQKAAAKNSRSILYCSSMSLCWDWKTAWCVFQTWNTRAWQRANVSWRRCFITAFRIFRCWSVCRLSWITWLMSTKRWSAEISAMTRSRSYAANSWKCTAVRICTCCITGSWKNTAMRHCRRFLMRNAFWNMKMFIRCCIWNIFWKVAGWTETSVIWWSMRCRIIPICSIWSWIRCSPARWRSSEIKPRPWRRKRGMS